MYDPDKARSDRPPPPEPPKPVKLIVQLPACERDRLMDAALAEGLGPSAFIEKLIGRWYVELGLGPIGEDDA